MEILNAQRSRLEELRIGTRQHNAHLEQDRDTATRLEELKRKIGTHWNAPAHLEQDRDTATCTVCLGERHTTYGFLREPPNMPCGHAVCGDCAGRILANPIEARRTCPMCRVRVIGRYPIFLT